MYLPVVKDATVPAIKAVALKVAIHGNDLSGGFTLIELLVVIAIVAVISTVVILTLNPAELLKQSRDSNRMSDLSVLQKAIVLYQTDVPGGSISANSNCYVSIGSSPGANCGGWFTATHATVVTSTSRAVDGTGWLPVNFSAITHSRVISSLPLDPENNTSYYYAYAASSTNYSFEINANMESTKYAQGGIADVESKDGGSINSVYELGSNLTQ
ncbi:MAG: type II secretion system protein [Candidatus Liptonbacteria bacterium]